MDERMLFQALGFIDQSLAQINQRLSEICAGMPTDAPTLRDRFAMAALTGKLAAEPLDSYYPSVESAAEASYAYADAMLAAREVKP